MQAVQSNIIYAVGRLFVNWNTPNLKSVPFTQLQYLPPGEAHEYGRVIVPVVKDGQTKMKQFAIDPMNIHKLDIPGGVGILIDDNLPYYKKEKEIGYYDEQRNEESYDER